MDGFGSHMRERRDEDVHWRHTSKWGKVAAKKTDEQGLSGLCFNDLTPSQMSRVNKNI